MDNLLIETRSEIIMHFNKMHLQDVTIPMWVIKVKGETYYVNHIDVDSGVGFSTKETPNNEHTKGSLKFRAKLKIDNVDDKLMARIYT